MTEAAPRSFAMTGAREVLELAGGALHIEQQVRAIERAIAGEPHLAFDLARALVEAMCKTILGDRRVPCDGLGMRDLLGKTYGALQVVPEAVADRVRTVEALKRSIERLDDLIQCLTELRKEEGLASHGRDGFTASLEAMHAELAARAADAVVAFLYKVHRAAWSTPRPKRETYQDRADFNDWFDEQQEPISILGVLYRPSEVLFLVDHQAYRAALVEYGSTPHDAGEDGSPLEAVA